MARGPALAVGLLIATGGCVAGPRFHYYPPDPAGGHRIGWATDAEPDTDSGSLAVSCDPARHVVVVEHYWSGPTQAVALRAGKVRRHMPVAYDPDGAGLASFTLPASDPAITALRNGHAIRLSFAGERRLVLPPSAAVRRALAPCLAL